MNRRSFFMSGAALSSAMVGLSALRAKGADVDLCALEDLGHEGEADGEPKLVRLRSAENPYGPPPSAIQAVQQEVVRGNRYPRHKVAAFRQKIAEDVGLTPEHVAIGAGSIELMINTGIAYGKPGRAVLSAYPTWTTTCEYAKRCGGDWIRVPLTRDLRYDFDRMKDAITDSVDLVYICNPNNPTGIDEDHDTLEAFVKDVAKSRLVMVDEAFIDCIENAEQLSMKKLVADSENIIIARTFSKLWGMAGFRVGYMIGHPRVIAALKSTVPTLEMQSRLGVAGAMAAYDDHAFIAMSREKMRESKKIVYEIFGRRGLKYIASDSNFISFQVPESGPEFVKKMEAQGIALKAVSLGDDNHWARVSCGTPDELAAFDTALGKVL